jgi:hypothetical protein
MKIYVNEMTQPIDFKSVSTKSLSFVWIPLVVVGAEHVLQGPSDCAIAKRYKIIISLILLLRSYDCIVAHDCSVC